MRGLVNPVSNLPNLNALRTNKAGRQQALIAARILNYEEIVASLPASSERQLIDQIVSRLSVGAPKRTLYQGDGGIFAWFEEPRAPFGNHLDALYALFRNPARVDGLSLDLTIAFGVEVGSSRSLPNRLASALVAAEEAAHDGLKWKYHDPDSLQDASWKLSILSQLDSAIDRGEVWVAYQPKLDLRDPPDHRRRSARALDAPREGPDRSLGVRSRSRTARPHRQAHRLRARESRCCRRVNQQARPRVRNCRESLGAAADGQGLHAARVGPARAAPPAARTSDAGADRDRGADRQR